VRRISSGRKRNRESNNECDAGGINIKPDKIDEFLEVFRANHEGQ
jgi:hypothetical protein